jgi:hypothetical protein
MADSFVDNAALVLVAVAGIIVAIFTLIYIGSQTDEIRKSVRLQKVGMRQWVELIDWDERIEDRIVKESEVTYPVTFAILNPTKYLMDLLSCEIRVDNGHIKTEFYGFSFPPGDRNK